MVDSVTFVNTFFAFIRKMNDFIDETIYPSEQYAGEPDRIYYTLLHKLATVGDALGFLILNLDGKPHYCNSAIILARTCMLDTICLYYIMDRTDHEEEQHKRISDILNDHVRSVFQSTTDPAEKEDIQKRYPWCFENGKIKKNMVRITANGMLQAIQVETFKEPVTRALKLYNICSKVEHNGLFTFNIIHSHYNPGDSRTKQMMYDAAIEMAAVMVVVILHWTDQEDKRRVYLMDLYKQMTDGI